MQTNEAHGLTPLAKRLTQSAPRTTLEVIWDFGYYDAKSRSTPQNTYAEGSEESDAYERGYRAGTLARCYAAQGLSC
jgi:hypothetical protein